MVIGNGQEDNTNQRLVRILRISPVDRGITSAGLSLLSKVLVSEEVVIDPVFHADSGRDAKFCASRGSEFALGLFSRNSEQVICQVGFSPTPVRF